MKTLEWRSAKGTRDRGVHFDWAVDDFARMIIEMLRLCASRSDLISEVRVCVHPQIRRCVPTASFALDESYSNRGIALVGTQHLQLGGVARRIAARARRRLRRTGQKFARTIRGRSR